MGHVKGLGKQSENQETKIEGQKGISAHPKPTIKGGTTNRE